MEQSLQLGPEEQALLMGNLANLSEQQRGQLYERVCTSLGLNPYTRPFDYITLSGRLTLYAKKDATDQLRKLHGVSILEIEQQAINDVLFVRAKAQDRTGRTDIDLGAVSIGGLRGDGLANATMKAITKAKRRVTLSICGLGMLDETEIETIPTTAHQIVPVLPERSAVAAEPDAALRAAQDRYADFYDLVCIQTGITAPLEAPETIGETQEAIDRLALKREQWVYVEGGEHPKMQPDQKQQIRNLCERKARPLPGQMLTGLGAAVLISELLLLPDLAPAKGGS